MEATWEQELSRLAVDGLKEQFGFTTIEVKVVRKMMTQDMMFISVIADEKVLTGSGTTMNATIDALIRNTK